MPDAAGVGIDPDDIIRDDLRTERLDLFCCGVICHDNTCLNEKIIPVRHNPVPAAAHGQAVGPEPCCIVSNGLPCKRHLCTNTQVPFNRNQYGSLRENILL